MSSHNTEAITNLFEWVRNQGAATPKQIAQAHEQLGLAVCHMFNQYPLYYNMLTGIARCHAPGCISIGVGFTRNNILTLAFNAHFVNYLSLNDLRTVLQHEALHIGLRHIQRSQLIINSGALDKAKLAKITNYAADVIVNHYTHDLDSVTPALRQWLVTQDKFPFLHDKNISDMTFEDVFQLFMDNLPPSSHENNNNDSHDGWSSGELTDEQAAACDAILKDAVAQLGDRDAGNIPGELQRIINQVKIPAFNWRKQISVFAQSVAQDDAVSSWKRANRRLQFLSPGKTREYKPQLLVVVDNSGSTADIYTLLMSHVCKISSYMDIDVIGVDADVNFEYTFTDGKMPPAFIDNHSGGGTLAQPAFDYAKAKKKYNGIIYLTDGYLFDQSLQTYGIKTLFVIGPGGQHVAGHRNIDIPNEDKTL